MATRGGEGDRNHDDARRAARRRPRRRHAPALAVIIVVGLAAVAVVFALARALEDERPHGPYLIGGPGGSCRLEGAAQAAALTRRAREAAGGA